MRQRRLSLVCKKSVGKNEEGFLNFTQEHILLEICERYKAGLSWEQVCKLYGGVSIYVPKVSPAAKEKIKSEFNGYNTAFLAHKYNLSQNSVRNIIKELKSKE